jgi:large subunit ribosomal protein L9
MEVILREHVEKLGRRGDVVKVAAGYARNYLLPRKLALAVTDENRRQIERERKAGEVRDAAEKQGAEALAARLAELECVFSRRVGEHDALYGSVTSGDIAEFLAGKGIEIDKRKVQLEEPIKTLGEHEVKIRLHPEVGATLKLTVSKAD